MGKVDVSVFKEHNISYTDVHKRRCADVGPMSKIYFVRMSTNYLRDCTKDVDPTYRLWVNVNWFAVISYGNQTANIYVKKLYSLYKFCKGDFVVGAIKLQRSPLQHYKIPTSPLRTVRTNPTDSVMMKLEFCIGDLCSFFYLYLFIVF